MRYIRFITLLVFFFFCLYATLSLSAQDNDTRLSNHADIIFNELKLNNQAVLAYDTLGNLWSYDFDSGVFVPARINEELKPEIIIEPVTTRCTEERTVKPYEKGSVLVKFDEFVNGDIMAYGRVTVKGWVKGNVQSINQSVVVTESGQVDGYVKAPEIDIKEGGRVLGKQYITSTFDIPVKSFPYGFLVVIICVTAFFIIMGFLVVQLMPRQLDNFRECMCGHRVKTYLLGFLLVVLIPVITLLVAITIVGLVVVVFVPLLYIVAIAFGVISFGQTLGDVFSKKVWGTKKSILFSVFTGIFTLMLPWFLTSLLFNSASPVQRGFGIFFLVVSIGLSTFPVFCGVGAAFLTRWGFRKYISFADRMAMEPFQAPAPPPIPKEPPVITPSMLKPEKPDSETSSGKGPLSSEE